MRSLRAVLLPSELGRDFRKLWSAAAISNLGDGAMLAASPLLVASITDEPAAVGAAVFAQQLPWLLFALFSGALVDRLDHRLMVVAADTFRAVVLDSSPRSPSAISWAVRRSGRCCSPSAPAYHSSSMR